MPMKNRYGMDILCAQLKNYKVLNKIWTSSDVPTRSPLHLSHRIHGPSPTPGSVPIFVLHGLLGSKKNWENMCKSITAHTNRSVIAVDARNHGDSPHSDSHRYTDLASDVSKLLTSFSLEKGVIIGHSMGGKTAMVLALSEPSKVESLIVVDISPVSSGTTINYFFPKLIDIMMSVDFKGLNSLHKAQSAAKDTILKSGVVNNMNGMHFILMNIGKKPDGSFGWKSNINALKNNFNHIASFPSMPGVKYMGPTLFIGGKLSYYIPPEDITGIRQLFPTAQLHYITGAGHNVHVEQPTTFLNLVINFLYPK